MNYKTKYNVGDAVMVGKFPMKIKVITIRHGLLGFPLVGRGVTTKYEVESPQGGDWIAIYEKFIVRKATPKEWIKAGGEIKK